MLRRSHWFALALLVLVPLSIQAQVFVRPVVVASPPVVTYYQPVVPAPVVAYYPAPVTTFFAPAPTFVAPAPTFVAPAPVSVSTVRYGLFGLRGVTTVNYGAPVVAYPTLVPRPVFYRGPVLLVP